MIATARQCSNARYLNVDLHCHSIYSDGELTPDQLVERAVEKNVVVLALTDHDTIAGVRELQHAAAGRLQIITGIEFSSVWNGVGIHIVGLNFDLDVIAEATAEQLLARDKRAHVIAERLEKKGFFGAYEGARSYAQNSLGRAHFSRWLVDQGYCRTQAEAFKKWLGAGKVGDVKVQWPEMSQVISWIHDAGGVAVLAHPIKYRMTNRKLAMLVGEFAGYGGDSLEIATAGVDVNQVKMLARIAGQNGLSGSRGSDFHSPRQFWSELGKAPGLPAEVPPVWFGFVNE
ncbi:PHP domain-containing protein [Gynuella sunshinyii]|uniref:PHP domain-containing protein n=1 Tax=Gynuella sunshinyii TaxID=1445505 RepID=UPI0005CC4A42|nr:PHP domain-containing protein [Gynuella sunshinyii]